MSYYLVRFTDGVYHVAHESELKNKNEKEASVFWKGKRTSYYARIIQESKNKQKLLRKKKQIEKDELEDKTANTASLKSDRLIWKELQCVIPYHDIIKSASQIQEPIAEINRTDSVGLIGEELQCVIPYHDIIKSASQIEEPIAEINRTDSDGLIGEELQCVIPYHDIIKSASQIEEPIAEINRTDSVGLIGEQLQCVIPYHDIIKSVSQIEEPIAEMNRTDSDGLIGEELQSDIDGTNGSQTEEPISEINQTDSDRLIWEELNSDIPYNKVLEFEPISEINQTDSDMLIWEELNSDIPYNKVLEFENSYCNWDSASKSDQSKCHKINIISNKIIVPDNDNSNKINIPRGNNSGKGSKGKQQYCMFCFKLVNKFGRHIITVHKQEKEIKTIISLEKQSEQRRKLIDNLRRKGNFFYNHGDFKSGSNIVARRPINKKSPTEYMDCPTCFVRISKVSLRRHVRKCNNTDSGRRTQVDSKRVTFDLHKIAGTILKEQVFPVLKNDLITKVLRKDHLAILYGNKLVSKYSATYHHKMIRANLRYIGKYLIEMRKLSPSITDFKSCFCPAYYDISITAIRKVAGYDETKGEYRAPYSASAIGTILKFCCAILESEFIKTGNTEKLPQVQNFLKLLKTELTTDINKTVTENLTSIRRSKKVVLPTSSDMSKLINHIRFKRDQLLIETRENFSFELWRNLGSYTLVGIMVYNGRRPGEIERLLLSDFKESSQSNNDFESSSETGTSNYTRCVIRGKLCGNVSVVLSTEEVNCINYILECRELAGVCSDNQFVFGLPGRKPYKFLNAGLLLKKMKKEANIEHPERMFATNIRKNLATKSTKLSLNPEEKDHIMQFMGHSEKIHKNIYRQPDMEKDITVMPKVLDFATGKVAKIDVTKDKTIEGKQPVVMIDKLEYVPSRPENVPSGSEYAISGSDYGLSDFEYDDPENQEYQGTKPKRKRRLIDMSLGYIKRTSWSTEERHTARELFKDEIMSGDSPSIEKCKNAVNKNDTLKYRSPNQLKAWINNQIKSKKNVSKERIKKTWSTPEKRLCRDIFGDDVAHGAYPSRQKIAEVIQKYPILHSRTPEQVVSHLQHAIKKTSRS